MSASKQFFGGIVVGLALGGFVAFSMQGDEEPPFVIVKRLEPPNMSLNENDLEGQCKTPNSLKIGKTLQDEVNVASLPEKYRFVYPGDHLTSEWIPFRLNLVVNQEDLVVGTFCG